MMASDETRAQAAADEALVLVVFPNHSTLMCLSQSLHWIRMSRSQCRLLYLGWSSDLKQGPGRVTRALAVKSD